MNFGMRPALGGLLAVAMTTGLANAQTAVNPPVATADASAPQVLSRAQFIYDMDAEFARMDADRNGKITAQEVASFRQNAAQAEALRQNAGVFARLDADRNGTLSLAEFAQLANPSAINADPAPMMRQFDLDRDGAFTLIEYRVATQANFDRLDKDRDGIVSQAEMAAGAQATANGR